MPAQIQIRFVSFQYRRWMRAVDRLRAVARIEQDRLPYRMAVDYTDLLRVNITGGKFAASYKPYNARYYEWKYYVFNASPSFGFWRLRGELLRSISVFKERAGKDKGWMGGIPSGEMDSGNVSWLGKGDFGRRIPIALYARWMEYGRKGQPARPLFQPTLVEYHTEGAINQLDVSRLKLKGAWK